MVSKLDFNIIDTHSFKTLGVVDTSWYNPDISIETPTIEILLPGYTLAVSPYFLPKSLNIFNSNTLGLTKASCEEELVDLPDGLWKIKYSICPNNILFVEKFFLKTDKIQCKYDKAFLSLDFSNISGNQEKKKREDLAEIEVFISGAIAAANNQNSKLSSDLYKKANSLLSKFEQCTC